MGPGGRRTAFLISALLVVVLLVILAASVGQLVLLPGKPLPSTTRQQEEEPGASEPAPSFAPSGLIPLLLVVAFAGILALLLSEREFRRRVLRALALAAILVAALFLVRPLPLTPSNAPGSQAPVHGVPASSGAGDDVVVPQAPNPKTSNALTLLVAVGAAALLTGLGLATWLWAKPRLWAHADPAVLDELALEAGRAADAIRAGDDPRDAVLRCYKEMCRVLARHGAVRESSSLTPREFASLLRARGMVNQHADRLTWIFEEVRYGSRPSAPLAGQAVACLEAIQAAYAGGTA